MVTQLLKDGGTWWQTKGELTVLNSSRNSLRIPRVTEMCVDGSVWYHTAQHRSGCVKVLEQQHTVSLSDSVRAVLQCLTDPEPFIPSPSRLGQLTPFQSHCVPIHSPLDSEERLIVIEALDEALSKQNYLHT